MAKTIHASQIDKVAGEMFGVKLKKLETLASSIHKSLLNKIDGLEKRVVELEDFPSGVIIESVDIEDK